MVEQKESSSDKKITMTTVDGGLFVVDESVAMEFQTVKSFIEDNGNNDNAVIPLPNVSSAALSQIIEYCKRHVEFRAKSKRLADDGESSAAAKSAAEEVKAYDANYVKNISNEDIKELILAANYLNAKELLDFLNQTVADRIHNKSVEYVRKFFGIENDYTPEEEETLRRENAWAFEGVDAD